MCLWQEKKRLMGKERGRKDGRTLRRRESISEAGDSGDMGWRRRVGRGVRQETSSPAHSQPSLVISAVDDSMGGFQKVKHLSLWCLKLNQHFLQVAKCCVALEHDVRGAVWGCPPFFWTSVVPPNHPVIFCRKPPGSLWNSGESDPTPSSGREP